MDLLVFPSYLSYMEHIRKSVMSEGSYLSENAMTINEFWDRCRSDLGLASSIKDIHLRIVLRRIIEKKEIFKGIAGIEGEVLKFIKEIKYINQIQNKFADRNYLQSEKWHELFDIMADYEGFLSENTLLDDIDILYNIFSNISDIEFIKKYESIIFKNFIVLEKEEIGLISRLKEIKNIVIEIDVPKDLEKDLDENIIISSLQDNYKINPVERQNEFHLYEAKNPDIEIRTIMQLILHCYDIGKEISIVAKGDMYDRLNANLENTGVDFYSGKNDALFNDIMIRLFLLIFDAIDNKFSNNYMISLVSSGIFKFSDQKEIIRIIKDALFLDDLLLWKKASDKPGFHAFLDFLQDMKDIVEGKNDLCGNISILFDLFFENTTRAGENFIFFRQGVEETIVFMKASGFDLTYSEFRSMILEIAEQTPVIKGKKTPASFAVKLINEYDALTIEHDVLFIPALNSGVYPGRKVSFPIFSFDEIEGKIDIENNFRFYSKEEFKFRYLLHVSEFTYLTYSQNEIGGTPIVRSFFLNEFDVPELHFEGDTTDIAKYPSYFSFSKRDRKYDEKGAELHKRIQLLKEHDWEENIAGIQGHIGFIEKDMDFKEYSVTALQSYADCPYSFFCRYILKLQELIYEEDEEDNYLEGLIYHDVLSRMKDQFKNKKLEEKALNRIFDEVIAHHSSTGALRGADLLIFKKLFYRKRIFDFLLREFEVLNDKPIYFELQIGGKKRNGADDNSVFEIKPLRVGKDELYFTGSIDRVDRDVRGDHILIDYKSGIGALKNKLRLCLIMQHHIYKRLFEENGFGKVISFSYKSIKMKETKTMDFTDSENIEKFMEFIVKRIKKGKFPFYYDKDTKDFTYDEEKKDHEYNMKCNYCIYKTICRRNDKCIPSY